MASRDKIIAKAEKLVAKGKTEDAITEYERLLDDNPNDVNTLNRIGDLWVRISRTSEAVKVFTKIANHYSRDGFFLKAIAIYKKINKLDPSKLEVYGFLAELYAKQGLAMEAKSQYIVLADYYLKQGDPGNALATYLKIAELDPNSINVHVKLADLYSQNNQKEDALKEYDSVGKMLLKRGMSDEAVQVFKKAIKIEPQNIELVSSFTDALIDANDPGSAIELLEGARENSGDDPRIEALLGKAFIAKGDISGAQAALDHAYAVSPHDATILEALSDLNIKQGNFDRAFEILEPKIDELSASRDDKALMLLEKILKKDSSHLASLRKMVTVYEARNEETKILSSLNTLAEAFIAKSRHAEAAEVLERLVAVEPQNAQHKEKLAFVQDKAGITPAASAPPPAKEIETVAEPEPEPVDEIDGDLSLDFDTGPSLDLDEASSLDLDLSEPEPAAEVVSEPLEVEEVEEDLDFITEHMTEAEVFAKYGLTDKALDHLRSVIDRAPHHHPAHERLIQLLLDEGDTEEARKAGHHYVSLLRELGDDEAAENVETELVAKGVALGAAPVAPPPEIDEAVEPETPIEMAGLDFELGTGIEESAIELDIDEAESEEPAIGIGLDEAEPEEPAIELGFDEAELEEPAIEIGFDEAEVKEPAIEIGLDEAELEEPSIEIGLDEAQPEEPAIEIGLDEAEVEFDIDEPKVDLDFEEMELEEPSLDFDEPEVPMEVEAAEPELEPVPVSKEPSQDELGEIDFYIEQELFDEARSKLDSLDADPAHSEVVARRERLEQAAAKAAKGPQELSALDIENELLSAIPDDDEEVSFPEPAAGSPAPLAEAPSPDLAAADEDNLFADEDDFFDLASELEDELEDELEEEISLGDEEQSLEEVFQEFKRGVEEQLDAEDYETHYNLGIAYKEMGLIDEAIGEFQLASKDPKRAVECCSMLGLCFLEKGMPQLAVKWYTKGIEMPEITEDENLGLLYELALAHLETGDTKSAHKTFVEIFGINSTYRDVTGRIKQLENVTQG